MNIVILTGRIVRDIEVKYAGSKNTAVARFSVAVDKRFKREGQPEADFINCVAFGKTAEFIEKYFKKGQKINIQGEWTTGSYTNKDGQKVYTNDCTVASVEFGESMAASQKSQNTSSKNDDGFANIPDDIDEELPFS